MTDLTDDYYAGYRAGLLQAEINKRGVWDDFHDKIREQMREESEALLSFPNQFADTDELARFAGYDMPSTKENKASVERRHFSDLLRALNFTKVKKKRAGKSVWLWVNPYYGIERNRAPKDNVTRPIVKEIGYAYPTSNTAKNMKRYHEGCYYLANNDGHYDGPFTTLEGAENFANQQYPDIEYGYYSMRVDKSLEKWRQNMPVDNF